MAVSVSFTTADASANSAVEVSLRNTINHYAKVGINANWTETQPYYCSRFVRQVFQRAFPKNAQMLGSNYFGGTAYETERKWAKQNRLRSYNYVMGRDQLREGDVVFQDYPVYGHVGVVVKVDGQLMIAENTVRYGAYTAGGSPRWDYRFFTTLKKFGKIRTIGRIGGFSSIEK